MLAIDRKMRAKYESARDQDTLVLKLAGVPGFRATLTICRHGRLSNMVRVLISAPRELLVLRAEMEDET